MKSACNCTTLGKWIFVPYTKQCDGKTRGGVSKNGQMNAIVKANEGVLVQANKDKCFKRIRRITPIPKNMSEIQFLTALYNGLSESGVLPGGAAGIMRAVNTTSKAKQDLDDSKQWNGDIQIAENLKLKLYKTGLVLHTKK